MVGVLRVARCDILSRDRQRTLHREPPGQSHRDAIAPVVVIVMPGFGGQPATSMLPAGSCPNRDSHAKL